MLYSVAHVVFICFLFFFFFKQKTAYEMRISDWSSDVCSSDLSTAARLAPTAAPSLSASGTIYCWKVSLSFNARPPEKITLAEVSSGRSLLTISEPPQLEMHLSPVAAQASTAAHPPSRPSFLKAVQALVMPFLASDDWTFSKPLHALVGL